MPHDIFHLLEPAYRSLSRQQVAIFFISLFSMVALTVLYSFVRLIFSELFMGCSIWIRTSEWSWRSNWSTNLPLSFALSPSSAMGLVRPSQPWADFDQYSSHKNSQYSGKTEISSRKKFYTTDYFTAFD